MTSLRWNRPICTPGLLLRAKTEACIGGGEGLPVSYILEVNRKVSHIPLSKLENIPLIKFPKYPVSLEVNKNIPEITGTK